MQHATIPESVTSIMLIDKDDVVGVVGKGGIVIIVDDAKDKEGTVVSVHGAENSVDHIKSLATIIHSIATSNEAMSVVVDALINAGHITEKQ